MNSKPKEALGKSFHHSVYVILLDPAVLRHPSILRLNPNRDPAKPCVYVGMTGLAIEDRFQNHKKGYKSAWVVEKYGLHLMPELYEYLNPMPFERRLRWKRIWPKSCERRVIPSPVVPSGAIQPPP